MQLYIQLASLFVLNTSVIKIIKVNEKLTACVLLFTLLVKAFKFKVHSEHL